MYVCMYMYMYMDMYMYIDMYMYMYVYIYICGMSYLLSHLPESQNTSKFSTANLRFPTNKDQCWDGIHFGYVT